MIPYGKQSISADDIEAVVDVLRSDFLTQGPVVPQFEEAVCKYVGSRFGMAANSATSALHIACLALGLCEGDLLWTSPITFVASANCGLYCGAELDFVDIDADSFNMCPNALKIKLEEAASSNRLPKVLVVVHMAGNSAPMEQISRLARQYEIAIIEDASHAIGGSYQGKPIGNCEWSDVSIFSFHPVKIITTGEGGIAVTNSSEIASRMEIFRSHGVTRNRELMDSSQPEPWYYEQIALGYNYRMTEIQAALGKSQLCRVDNFVQQRAEAASIYARELSHLPLKLPSESYQASSSWHLYIIQINNDLTDLSRLEVFQRLRDKSIGVNVHYIPVYRQPYYRAMGFFNEAFPAAESFYEQCISIPLFPEVIGSRQTKVIEALNEVFPE